MPTLYQSALMLVRLFAGINLIAGLAAVITFFATAIVAAFVKSWAEMLEGAATYLFDWGGAALVSGIALLLCGKAIARFAARQ